MNKPHLISAICTPLADDETLHHEGLRAHLDQQTDAHIDGVLIAGTMGLMQLLTDDTYQQLIATAVDHWHGQGEILIGVGDLSNERTKQRIEYVNRFPVDGTVALTPYFIKFSQTELIDYYRSLAETSKSPMYLYDLPQVTGTHLTFNTVTQLSHHPNIAGIKCSGDIAQARRLNDALRKTDFRVIVAQPLLLDVLINGGIDQHLDGIYAIAPHWARDIADLAAAQEKTKAARAVERISRLMDVITRFGVFPTVTFLLNQLGVPGNSAPRPHMALNEEERTAVLQEPIVQQLFESKS